VSQLLVSPDGELNLVPFEALRDQPRHYLVERYTISYLTSGRDLLRLQAPRGRPTRPVIVADPVFGDSRRGALYFGPLAATAGEARAIKALFPQALLWTGRDASKAAVQEVHAPLVLHIASHGFFFDDRAAEGARGGSGNPLLRSGLAFANANASRDGGSAILTALEASRLDLWGTRLVTLSACETGVGEVENGEGVYGLRRAFELAGAETMVMTLWSVNDYATRDAMIAYYTGLRDGLGRAAALRRVKLAMLAHGRHRHPYYWAGFIQSGEWANLQGRR
jgi:CHAT domain-containing protein